MIPKFFRRKTLQVCSLVLFLICCLHPHARAQVSASGATFDIKGEVVGLDTGLVTLRYWDRKGKETKDTAAVISGKFRHQVMIHQSGHPREPIDMEITLGNTLNQLLDINDKRLVLIHVEPGEVTVSLERDNFKSVRVTGPRIHDDIDALNAEKKHLLPKKDALLEAYYKLEQDQSDGIIEAAAYAEQSETLIADYSQILEEERPIDSAFIVARPDSYYSAYLIRDYYYSNKWSMDVAYQLLQSLDDHVRTGTLGIYLAWAMQSEEESQIGQLVPALVAPTHDGSQLDLNDYQNQKVVLLDFWASYCVPCREAIPELKAIYDEYRDKGLEVIGVSADKNRDSWYRAIREEGVSWPQVLSDAQDGGVTEAINGRFNVIGIPHYILIDKSGRIVGRYATLEGGHDDGLSIKEKIDELLK